MAQKVYNIGTDVIEIPIQIGFKVTDHFNKRLAGRNLSQDNIIEVVRQALPFLLKKKINKRKETTSFTVCDKQTCIVAIVELNEESNIMQQTALIRTSYIFDGKGEPLQPNTFFIMRIIQVQNLRKQNKFLNGMGIHGVMEEMHLERLNILLKRITMLMEIQHHIKVI
jgi:hypothetical protein